MGMRKRAPPPGGASSRWTTCTRARRRDAATWALKGLWTAEDQRDHHAEHRRPAPCSGVDDARIVELWNGIYVIVSAAAGVTICQRCVPQSRSRIHAGVFVRWRDKVAHCVIGEPMPEPRCAAHVRRLSPATSSSPSVRRSSCIPQPAFHALQTGGAALVIVNREPIPLDQIADVVLRGDIGDILEPWCLSRIQPDARRLAIAVWTQNDFDGAPSMLCSFLRITLRSDPIG